MLGDICCIKGSFSYMCFCAIMYGQFVNSIHINLLFDGVAVHLTPTDLSLLASS